MYPILLCSISMSVCGYGLCVMFVCGSVCVCVCGSGVCVVLVCVSGSGVGVCVVLRLPYPWLFGGVTALNSEQFEKINGYPNNYWGWGGEDDDVANR